MSPSVCQFPGSGKTALAVHVAHAVADRFPDGNLFLDLHSWTPDATEVSPTAALDRFLRLLGVPGEQIPAEPDDRAALYRGCLRGMRLLVVLDNAGSARQIESLLPGEPGCRVLVTSRNRLLALDDAHHVSLGVLSVAEATALFGSVAGSGRIAAEPDAARWVASTVAECGRLPLAIRIAAARWRGNPGVSLADFSARLHETATRLGELDDGERSVRACFQESYRGLPDDQRRLLRLLALHPGADVSVPAAGALAGAEPVAVARVAERLGDAHLVVRHPGDRYRFHDLLRLFAWETAMRELSEPDRTEAVLRMMDHGLHGVASADELLTPYRYRPEVTYDHLPPAPLSFTDVDDAMAWVRAEWPNLVALCRLAAERGLDRRCWQFAFLLRGFFFQAKLWDPWIETHTLALAAARRCGDRWAQAVSLNNLGIAYVDRGEVEIAEGHYRDAMAIFDELGDEHGRASARANRGWAYHYRGEHTMALADLRAAFDFYQRTGAMRNAAITLRGMALAEIEIGAHADAVRHAGDALEMLDALGLDFDATMALNCLGWARFRSGHHDEAAEAYRRAVEIGERVGSAHEVARAQTGLGNVAAAQDRPNDAQRHWELANDSYPDLNATIVGERRARLAVDSGA